MGRVKILQVVIFFLITGLLNAESQANFLPNPGVEEIQNSGQTGNLLLNPGMESQSGSRPANWGAGAQSGTARFTFSSMRASVGSTGSHSGLYYSRFSLMPNQSGWVWVNPANVMNVLGFNQVKVSSYVRSNMKNVVLEIKEFNAAGVQIARQTSTAFKTPEWRWYLTETIFSLNPATAKVRVAVLAEPWGNLYTSYLDLDDGAVVASRGEVPLHWQGGGQAGITGIQFLSMYSPANSYSGNRYARLMVPAGQKGWVWCSNSKRVPVTGNQSLSYNQFIRTNMASVLLQVKEYNAAGQLIRTNKFKAVSPSGWGWFNYQQRAGNQSIQLLSQTTTVTVGVLGNLPATGIAYLDIDHGNLSMEGSQLELGVHNALEWGSPLGLAGHVALNKSLGAKVGRSGILWHIIQPTAVAAYNWNYHDQFINAMKNNGVEPMLVISTSPRWVNGCPLANDYDCLSYVPTDPAAFAKWKAEYKKFIQAVVTRYKGKVRYWELWNEPNIDHFWKPKPNPAQYAEWAMEISKAIHQIDPTAQVGFGGGLLIFDHAFVPGRQIAGKDFIKAAYDRLRQLDSSFKPKVITVHSYTWGVSIDPNYPGREGDQQNAFRDIAIIRRLTNTYGTGNEEYWITEFGWQDQKSGKPEAVTEQQKTKYFRDAVSIIRTEMPYVTKAIWFWDYDRDPSGQFSGFGLVDYNKEMNDTGRTFRELSLP